MRNNSPTGQVTSDKIQFTPVQYFHQVLQQFILEMADADVRRDFMGILKYFNYVYVFSFYYIKPYMAEDDVYILEDFSTIEEKLALIKEETNDGIAQYNRALFMQIEQEMLVRKKRLFTLMAKAQIFLPMQSFNPDLPTPLLGDDLIGRQ